jgi:hypothetical protein
MSGIKSFQHKGAYAVLAVIVAAAFAVSRSRKKPSGYAQVGSALFFFPGACTRSVCGLGFVPVT